MGGKLEAITDHRAITWLYRSKKQDGRIARWLEKLGQFKLEIKQEAAKKITHDDCLSQIKLLLMKCLSKQVKQHIFGPKFEKKALETPNLDLQTEQLDRKQKSEPGVQQRGTGEQAKECLLNEFMKILDQL